MALVKGAALAEDERKAVAAELSALTSLPMDLVLRSNLRIDPSLFRRKVLEAEDNGPGLAPADLAQVFERFWRASERPGGCGLGLAIVAAIAQRHGGAAAALTVQPRGLCIRLTLPLTAAGK